MKNQVQNHDIATLESIGKHLEQATFEEGLLTIQELKTAMSRLDFTGHEELQAQMLMRMGIFYGKSAMHEAASKYFTKVLKLAKTHKLEEQMIRAQSNLAICNAQSGNYQEAIKIWEGLVAEDIDEVLKLNVMNNLSVGYGRLGVFHQSLEYAFRTLDIAKRKGDEALELSPMMNLSTAYEKMGDIPRALEYINHALAIARKISNVRRETECLNNLSLIHNELGHKEEALRYAEECLALRIRYFAKPDQSVSYNNIGYIYEGLGDYAKALKYYKKSLALSELHFNSVSRLNTLLNVSSIYLIQNKTEQALKYLEDARIKVDDLQISDLSVRYYSQISEIQAKNGNFEEAYASQRELNNLINKLYRENLEHSINKSEAEFYRKRIEEQAEQYRLQNKELKQKNRIIRKNSKELSNSYQSMQDTVETLNWVVSVISHDVRAPLANFDRIVGMILDGDFPEDEIDDILHSIKRSSLNMYKLVDEMLDGIRLQRRKLDDRTNILNQDIIPHLQQIINIYQPIAMHKFITLTFEHRPEQIYALVDSDLLKIVVRNLLNNAVKFTPEKGTISLIAQENNENVRLTISDTGVGMSRSELKALTKRKKTERKTGSSGIGLGWILCRDAIKKTNGSMTISSEPGLGTTIAINLPKA
jgi:two-component system, sensor histidine kinase and response regulator